MVFDEEPEFEPQTPLNTFDDNHLDWLKSNKYGGLFPWSGRRYQIKVHGGSTLCGWISKMVNAIADIRFFHVDGSIRRKSMKTVSFGSIQLCWRWVPVEEKMVIDFLWGGKRLSWRWDELRPSGDVSSLVTTWEGVSYIGCRSYSFTMTLIPSDTDSIPKRVPSVLLQQSDSICDISLAVHSGSVLGGVTVPQSPQTPRLEPHNERDQVRTIASKYNDIMNLNKKGIDQIQQRIDSMWLQELVLQSTAELLIVLIATATEVELGSNPSEGQTRNVNELQKISTLAFDSFRVRSGAREEKIDGSLARLRESLSSQLAAVKDEVQPLIDMLGDPGNAADVKNNAEKRLQNIVTELQSLSEFKEANSDTFLVLEESLDDLQHGGSAFVRTVLQAAQANPQNATLQKTCVDTLMCLPDASDGFCEEAASCAKFLFDAMAAHSAEAALLEACCKALSHLARHCPQAADHIGSRSGIQRLLKVIADHVDNEAVLAAAISALFDLVSRCANSKLVAVSLGATDAVHSVALKLGAPEALQKIAFELLGVLVLASVTHKALLHVDGSCL